MEIRTASRLDETPEGAIAIVPYFAKEDLNSALAEHLRSLDLAGYEEASAREELKGSLYKTALFRGPRSALLVGLGKRQDFDLIRLMRAVGAATHFATRRGFSRLAVVLPPDLPGGPATKAAVEGAIRGVYDEGLLKTQERESYRVDEVVLVGPGADMDVAERARVVAESSNLARDLLNLPPNDLTPRILAEKAAAVGKEANLDVRILDENEISRLGMGAILAVAKGSAEPPRVVDMRYGDENAPIRLALVGKGLTFDSGGLSLKPADAMEWMKGDMGGSAAVVGAMRAIGILKPAGIWVRGLIGSVENMPGPAAMKPGDVLRTMNGKTIEVLNTDAEGRLVLSDMLAYAVSLGATHIVDLATLTGAAVIALGEEAAAIVGRPQPWIEQVKDAAGTAIERLWQLPLYPEYRRRMNSDIADMKNTGGRPGGALTAAAMLSEFVDDVPWAHLDIAGTAWIEHKTEYAVSGGTGYGVATLVELAFDMSGRTT
jgi:leucyl aminopeptidase